MKFLTKYIGTEFFKQARERTVTRLLGELSDAITRGSGLATSPLVDAWGVCTITCDGSSPELVVAGCQMTVAPSSHPIAGEDEAKAQFQAIRRTLPRAGHKPIVAAVSESPWVLWVLPAQHYRRLPFQHAKDGEVPGTVWPFRQGKIGVVLSMEGRTPRDV